MIIKKCKQLTVLYIPGPTAMSSSQAPTTDWSPQPGIYLPLMSLLLLLSLKKMVLLSFSIAVLCVKKYRDL